MNKRKQNSPIVKFGIILAIILLPVFLLLFFLTAKHNFIELPYYGEVYINESGDSVYHSVPTFTLLNQDSLPVTEEWIQNKIVVVDFFFSTCPTICPIMTKQMRRLQIKLDDPAFDDVRILSVTVNPEFDTPKVLKEYGIKNQADFTKWTFATGNREVIYDLAFNGFLVNALEDDEAPGGFLHSELFILVDKNGHVRGFYEGTESDDVDNLADDIKLLLKEEKIKNERAK
jgi:protein SCO1/2